MGTWQCHSSPRLEKWIPGLVKIQKNYGKSQFFMGKSTVNCKLPFSIAIG